MAGSTSIPGASLVEGGTAALSVSGRSIALWARARNAQFLLRLRDRVHGKPITTYLIVETTPPLLIVSLCSVKTITFASGYSRGESCCSGFEGNGVKKKLCPVCDYATVSDKLWNRVICEAYCGDICKDASQEVQLSFALPLVEFLLFVHERTLNECVHQQWHGKHVPRVAWRW